MNGQPDMLTLKAARAAVGVRHHATLKRMLTENGIALYASPGDKRVRLIRRADLDALTRPRLLSGPPEGGQPSPNAA